jgi:hypothetical protein
VLLVMAELVSDATSFPVFLFLAYQGNSLLVTASRSLCLV